MTETDEFGFGPNEALANRILELLKENGPSGAEEVVLDGTLGPVFDAVIDKIRKGATLERVTREAAIERMAREAPAG